MSQGQVGAILVLSLLLLAGIWAVLEWKTLTDNIPYNHITAVIRTAYYAEPGPFMLLSFIAGFFFGHFVWGGRQ